MFPEDILSHLFGGGMGGGGGGLFGGMGGFGGLFGGGGGGSRRRRTRGDDTIHPLRQQKKNLFAFPNIRLTPIFSE